MIIHTRTIQKRLDYRKLIHAQATQPGFVFHKHLLEEVKHKMNQQIF